MTRHHFSSLIEEFCKLTGFKDLLSIAHGAHIEVDGIVFSLAYSEKINPDLLFIYCDFGDPPAGRSREEMKAQIWTLYDEGGKRVIIKPSNTGWGHGIQTFFVGKEIGAHIAETDESIDAPNKASPYHYAHGYKPELRIGVYADYNTADGKPVPMVYRLCESRHRSHPPKIERGPRRSSGVRQRHVINLPRM